MASPLFRRPLLKLSGEVLGGPSGVGFDRGALETSARELAGLAKHGITPALVLGGGNFFRGARGQLPAVRRHRADFIGMLATVMNALCFAEHLRDLGVATEVFSVSRMDSICTFYQIDRARAALDAGTVCLFAAGTGAPYFSTDSAAALRAIEVGCDVLIKATKVDGIYDADPATHPRAKKFDRITYAEILRRGLGVMDLVAIALCRENRMPLIVLSMAKSGHIRRACQGHSVGSRVIEDDSP